MTLLPIVLVLLAGCVPGFEDRTYLVDQTRVLAIRGVPAEDRPNAPVTFEVLVGGPDGPVAAAVEWAWCTIPRRAEERTGVTASCLLGEDLEPIAATTTIRSDACALFGPIPPPVEEDEPAHRPADPDPTGGYYLPVHASTEDAEAFGFQRVRCDLPAVTREIFEEFEERYLENLHPTLDVLEVVPSAAPGARVRLTAVPAPDAAEPYVVYSAEDSALFDAVEVLTVNWYVTEGTLTTASEILEGAASAHAEWTLPDRAGSVHGWVILRDSRGGMTWQAFAVDVG